jgi:ribonuclease HII
MQSKYNSEYEIGIDEAGRGPLIGRVYAGAVILGPDFKQDDTIILNDSKKMTPKKRQLALAWIKKNVTAWGVGFAEASEIDQINILEATNNAMKRAVENLKLTFPKYTDINNLIVDGVGWDNRFPGYTVKSFVKGDSKYLSIACASIIAKEYHDSYIKEICSHDNMLDTKYDLLSNMGYGTKKHLAGIILHGPSTYHRMSFKPIKK